MGERAGGARAWRPQKRKGSAPWGESGALFSGSSCASFRVDRVGGDDPPDRGSRRARHRGKDALRRLGVPQQGSATGALHRRDRACSCSLAAKLNSRVRSGWGKLRFETRCLDEPLISPACRWSLSRNRKFVANCRKRCRDHGSPAAACRRGNRATRDVKYCFNRPKSQTGSGATRPCRRMG